MNRQRMDLAVRSVIWLVALGFWINLRRPPGSGLLPERSGLAALAGAGLTVLGAGVYIWAAHTIASGVPRAGAAPAVLVTRGPYRYLRHPIYLAAAVTFVGAATMYAPWRTVDLVAAGLVAVMVHLAVVWLEEPATRRRLGPAYDRYCARVPRWIPRWSRHE